MTALRPARLFVIAAPSGAGKTSLVNALKEREPNVRVSVSHTTRPRRPNEEHGREYFFVSLEEFERLQQAGSFLESAYVFDNRYGTSRAQLEEKRAAGYDVILEIDWQGARQVRNALPDCVTVFILPPSRSALEARLRNRRTDSDAVIARRLRDAVDDMRHCTEFDYIVVNDDFEHAVAELQQIVRGGAQARALQADRPNLKALVESLTLAP
jgi:guanylate kinase